MLSVYYNCILKQPLCSNFIATTLVQAATVTCLDHYNRQPVDLSLPFSSDVVGRRMLLKANLSEKKIL